MIMIAALDDQREWLKQEEEITRKHFGDEGCKSTAYHNVDRFLQDLEKGIWFDIYLLDVEMPDTNGIGVAREIKKKNYEAFIIYVTGYIEYAIEAFEVNAYRYIPKTMLKEKLALAYTSLEEKLSKREEGPYYAIELNSRMERIAQKDIYYFHKEKKYVVITQKDGISRVRASLDDVYRAMEETSFVRIDKGCIVNLRHIMKLEDRKVKMRNDVYLSVSQPQLINVKRRIAAYWRTTCQ